MSSDAGSCTRLTKRPGFGTPGKTTHRTEYKLFVLPLSTYCVEKSGVDYLGVFLDVTNVQPVSDRSTGQFGQAW
jgi:hypothetical protein